jgi:hypothetical protein
MSTMAESSTSLLEFLERLRKERDEISTLIAGIEKRLGISSESNPAIGASTPDALGAPRVKLSIDSIPVGFFHNMSQVQATEKLLRLNPGQPLTTNEIIDAFRKSGMEINPKNGATILYTSLIRNAKFERVAGKAWGLSDWYPERRKDKRSEEASQPEVKPKRRVKRKPAKASSAAASSTDEAMATPKIDPEKLK